MTENSQESNSSFQDALTRTDVSSKVGKVRELENQSALDPSSDPHTQAAITRELANNDAIRRFLKDTADIKSPAQIAEELTEELQKIHNK
jgi:hypothetical protein